MYSYSIFVVGELIKSVFYINLTIFYLTPLDNVIFLCYDLLNVLERNIIKFILTRDEP